MLRKTIAAIGIMVSVASITTVNAEAAWMPSNNGWWYTEGSSWATGWRNIDGKWYYFDGNGYMKTGWISDGGRDYYLLADGHMASNTAIGGYFLGSDGACLGSIGSNSSTDGSAEISEEKFNEIVVNEMCSLVNQHRKSNGKSEFKIDNGLNNSAYLKSKDMVDRNYYEHDYNGESFSQIVKRLSGENISGENIAWDNLTSSKLTESSARDLADRLFKEWKESYEHNQNMLSSSFNSFGFGIKIGKNNRVYATQHFSYRNIASSSKSDSVKKGWNEIGGKWYFYSNGVKKTGFINVLGNKYYLNDSGVMQTGWIKADGKWYYADGSGELYTSTTKTIGGVKYTFDKNGAWIEESKDNDSTDTSKTEIEKPVIKCENDPVYIYEDDDFDYALLEASAVDGNGKDISTRIQYSGHVDNTIPGSYNVHLKVTDSYGNKAEKNVCVRVKSRYKNVSNKGTKVTVTNTKETANGTISGSTTVISTISVTDIEITPNKIMCPVGSTSNKFTVNILPYNATDKSVTWKSSDTSIAKVDRNGNITAVGRGKATITCMASDGSEESVSGVVEVY